MSFEEHMRGDARLVILRTLSEQRDYRLNETLLIKALETFGHNRSRDFVRDQLRWLETEVAAVTLTEAGSVLIATLTKKGLDHVERRVVIEGIHRPSPGD